MDSIEIAGRRYVVDRAKTADLPALVALLRDDVLGAGREDAPADHYLKAFQEIDSDDHHLLVAVRNESDQVVATMQLTVIPGLSRGGTKRLQIEAVRVAVSERGNRLGEALFDWAHEFGRRRGAVLAQLTSDTSRGEAHRFYEALGYKLSHAGFKLRL